MRDLDIMLMLEEYGYEPSVENVIIFKEEEMTVEDLEEGFHPIAAIKQHVADRKVLKVSKSRKDSAEHGLKKEIADYRANHGGSKKGIKGDSDYQSAKELATTMGSTHMQNKNAARSNARTVLKYGADADIRKLKEEAISDYELYQILEASGYKTTEKNLAILKEGLETGKYNIIYE